MPQQLPAGVIVLIAAAPLVAIPLVFVLVCSILSLASGWRRLAASYEARIEPSGQRFGSRSGRIGIVSYRNCLIIHVSASGLFLSMPFFLRPGHKPLLIPWHAIHNQKGVKSLWREGVQFEVGNPSVAQLVLPSEVFQARGVSA